jgi:hypothetical protein
VSGNYGLTIRWQDDDWRILGEGTFNDGKVYCHLASVHRGRDQKNGWTPIQMADWIPQEVILSAAIAKEENQRGRKHDCVPWRGAGGDLGKCVYCGGPR